MSVGILIGRVVGGFLAGEKSLHGKGPFSNEKGIGRLRIFIYF